MGCVRIASDGVVEPYRYVEIRVDRGAWPGVVAAARTQPESVVGLFGAEIGAPASDGVVLSTGSAPVDLPGASVLATTRLQPTVRPVERPAGLDASGVYAHRWFDLAAADVEELIALSEGAWPEFEAATPGTRVIGLFRSLDAAEGRARVLLLTYYPSLADWERSRATGGAARAAFARRHQLTDSTIVRTYRLRV